jgi:tetratricopeptide (TPR) repeat protein/DNA-binding XRE family transcriptional regulator
MFGREVRVRRKALGLSQEDLANVAGVDVKTIGNIEAGRTTPRLSTVRLLADALGVIGAARERFYGSATVDATAVDVTVSAPDPLPVPAQLPAPVSGLVGRAAHLTVLDGYAAAATGQPPGVIVCAMWGSAGVGKTALAVHWAHRVRDQFPDGQLYVNLRGFDPSGSAANPTAVVRCLLEAFRVPPDNVPVDLDAQVGLYRSLMADKRVLIVLDNARDEEQVRRLIPGSPGCMVVVTSRNRLSGLVVSVGAHALEVDLLSVGEARQLLARRLGRARVTSEPAAADDIVNGCGRLPLALAIVAARAAAHPTFPLAAFGDELRDARGSLAPFVGEDRATDVRAVFSWSYRALSPSAADLFRRLSVHPGPDIGVPAVASLVGTAAAEAQSALEELSRAHLVSEHVPGRFVLHDLLRAYCLEVAHAYQSATERTRAMRRVLDHYLHSANAAALCLDPKRDPITIPGPVVGVVPEEFRDRSEALAWFTGEYPTLLAAITKAAGEGFHAHAWDLAWTLTDFLSWQGHWRQWAIAQAVALDCARRLDDPARRSYSHRSLAGAQGKLGRYHDAEGNLGRALELYIGLDDRTGQAHTHHLLGSVLDQQGRYAEALDHVQRAVEIYVAAGHRCGQARALANLGWLQAQLGDLQQATGSCRQALALLREIGDRHGEATTWDSLGYVHHHLDQRELAIRSYRQALRIQEDLGWTLERAETLVRLGDTYEADGDHDSARDAWAVGLGVLDKLGHPLAVAVRRKLTAAARSILYKGAAGVAT